MSKSDLAHSLVIVVLSCIIAALTWFCMGEPIYMEEVHGYGTRMPDVDQTCRAFEHEVLAPSGFTYCSFKH